MACSRDIATPRSRRRSTSPLHGCRWRLVGTLVGAWSCCWGRLRCGLAKPPPALATPVARTVRLGILDRSHTGSTPAIEQDQVVEDDLGQRRAFAGFSILRPSRMDPACHVHT